MSSPHRKGNSTSPHVHVGVALWVLFIALEGPFNGGTREIALEEDGEQKSPDGSDRDGMVGFEFVVPVLELLHLPLSTVRKWARETAGSCGVGFREHH